MGNEQIRRTVKAHVQRCCRVMRRMRARDERRHASERDFTEAVEQITGRKMWAFVSGMDTQRDVATEVFYLEPVPAG